MKVSKLLPILSLAAAVTLFTSGCIGPSAKTRAEAVGGVTSLGEVTAPAATIAAPVTVEIVFSQAKDEDLRKDLTGYIAEAMKDASVPTAANGSKITVTVEKVRRVSTAARMIKKEFAGTAQVDLTTTFPGGETVRKHVSGGMNLVLSLGHTTSTALKMTAETIAEDTKARLQTSYAAR